MSGSSRRPTLSTVAQRCGYSVNTVSRALRGDSRLPQSTIQKIREAADEVGYIPNRLAASLRSSESHVVAIIIEDIENPHYSHLMARIELELQARGYNVIILCNNRSLTTEKELAALAVSYSVSGVLLFPQDSVGTADGNSSAVQLLQANHIPVVIVDRAIQQQDIDCVRVDDEAGGYLAGKTLAQLGHQKYLYLAGPQNNTSQPLRQKGFLRAVGEAVSEEGSGDCWCSRCGCFSECRGDLSFPGQKWRCRTACHGGQRSLHHPSFVRRGTLCGRECRHVAV